MKAVKKTVNKKTMIDTKPFGKTEIEPKEIISFPEGIFAFEGLQEYVLLSTKKKLSFKWLQSIKEANVAFLMTDPTEFIPDYVPKIPKENLSIIELDESQEVNLFCIVTVPSSQPEKMTINLQGPILINFSNMLAAQFVSEDDSHQVRQPLFELIKRDEAV